MKTLFWGFAFIIIHSYSWASTEATLSTYRISHENLSESQILEINKLFEIKKIDGQGLDLFIPAAKIKELLRIAPKAQLLQRNWTQTIRSALQNAGPAAPSVVPRSLMGPITYHTIEQVQSLLKQLAQNRPDIVQYFEYGKSKEGLPLMGIKISDNPNADESEPELMFTASTHGDEIITTEILLGLIDRLQMGYGRDSRITDMIDNHELFFIPVVNADGFKKQFRYDDGRDPNRSYPSVENPENSPTPSIAPLIDFFHSREIKGSIDYHSSGSLIMFPWAYTFDLIDQPYFDEFKRITSSMAATNNYVYGPISQVIYIAKGSSADYYFWQKKTLSLGIEVGTQDVPQIVDIPSYTHEQAEALWRFIENF